MSTAYRLVDALARRGVSAVTSASIPITCPSTGEELVVCVDTLVEDVHFPRETPAADVGYKAVAVNLSDMAAMGAAPRGINLMLKGPEPQSAWIDRFARGVGVLCSRYGLSVQVSWQGAGQLAISIEAIGIVPSGRALLRRGASPGEQVMVTGTLGDAALALETLQRGLPVPPGPLQRLNRPLPRVEVGQALRGLASAGIDISDGLLADLGHILRASGVGARLDADALPLSAELRGAVDPTEARALALGFGDDYELCLCIPQRLVPEARDAAAAQGCPLTPVGRIEAVPGLRCLDANGGPVDVAGGFRHFG